MPGFKFEKRFHSAAEDLGRFTTSRGVDFGTGSDPTECSPAEHSPTTSPCRRCPLRLESDAAAPVGRRAASPEPTLPTAGTPASSRRRRGSSRRRRGRLFLSVSGEGILRHARRERPRCQRVGVRNASATKKTARKTTTTSRSWRKRRGTGLRPTLRSFPSLLRGLASKNGCDTICWIGEGARVCIRRSEG